MFTGALTFWTPVVLLEVLSKGRYSITVANVLAVVCSVCLYWLLSRGGYFRRIKFLSLYTLVGIYLLCPLSTTIAGSASGGGFSAFRVGGHDVLWLALAYIVPPLAMILAGYNGTLFSLLAITVIFVAVAIRRSLLDDPGAYPTKLSARRQ